MLFRSTAWGEGEEGSVGLERNGDFTVLIGTQSTGQGHETAYAQVVAQYLDVPIERIKVVQGDTDRIPTGNGTGGSRSIPIGAVMVSRASETLVGSLKELRPTSWRPRSPTWRSPTAACASPEPTAPSHTWRSRRFRAPQRN